MCEYPIERERCDFIWLARIYGEGAIASCRGDRPTMTYRRGGGISAKKNE